MCIRDSPYPQRSRAGRAFLEAVRDLRPAGEDVYKRQVYAFMQAMGLVNDHVADCVIRASVERARKSFRRPGSSEIPKT